MFIDLIIFVAGLTVGFILRSKFVKVRKVGNIAVYRDGPDTHMCLEIDKMNDILGHDEVTLDVRIVEVDSPE